MRMQARKASSLPWVAVAVAMALLGVVAWLVFDGSRSVPDTSNTVSTSAGSYAGIATKLPDIDPDFGDPSTSAGSDAGIVTPAIASSSNAAAATKDIPFVNTLGMKFVPVPGTEVLMCIHETRKKDYAAYALANPGLDESWKNVQFNNVPVSFEDDHPVVMVNWELAEAFCAWLGKKEGLIYRQPTDREWSYAAGIGGLENKYATALELSQKVADLWPWGTVWPPPSGAGNYGDISEKEKINSITIIKDYWDGYATTAPVTNFPPNALGIYDLGGNVWESCLDNHNQGIVLRGGSWRTDDLRGFLLSSHRSPSSTTARSKDGSNGFRCVLVVPLSKAIGGASVQKP